jgi:putative transcriptional regulator
MEWTQADLAERVGVSRQTINAIDTGKYDSSLSLAIGIARLFGKAVEEVFLLDVGPPRNSPSEQIPAVETSSRTTRLGNARISPVLLFGVPSRPKNGAECCRLSLNNPQRLRS